MRETTLQVYRNLLDVIDGAVWAAKPIDQIGKGDIAKWLDHIAVTRNAGKGLAPSSLNRYRTLISGVFRFAVERELVDKSPVAGVKKRDESGRAREDYFTVAELLALANHCPVELSLPVLVAAATGVRQRVLRALQWGDLDLDKGTMRVRASIAKGKRPQLFRLPSELVRRLNALRGSLETHHLRGDAVVFRTKTGRPWTARWMWELARRAIDTCPGIAAERRRKLSWHNVRHSYGTLLAEDGLGMRKLQEAMSHSDPRLTARYTHVDSSAMREASEKMGRILRLDGGDGSAKDTNGDTNTD